jgi:hypothetical protein
MYRVFLGCVLLWFTESRAIGVDLPHSMKGMTLMRAIYWGRKGARANYHLQISNIVSAAHSSLCETVPVIIGECGIPMDMK